MVVISKLRGLTGQYTCDKPYLIMQTGHHPGLGIRDVLAFLAMALAPCSLLQAQSTHTVAGKVTWYRDGTPLTKGEVRIDGHGSKLLQGDGSFQFDFDAFDLTGGESIAVSVSDQSGLLRVIDPPKFAPKPPKSDWALSVAKLTEAVAVSTSLTVKFVAESSLGQAPDLVANSCSPDWLLVPAAQQFQVTPQVFQTSVEAWAAQLGETWPDQSAAPGTRCSTWRKLQRVALMQKLGTDQNLLNQVKSTTAAYKLEPLQQQIDQINRLVYTLEVTGPVRNN